MHRALMVLGVRTGGRDGRWAVAVRGDDDSAMFRIHLNGGGRRIAHLRTLMGSVESADRDGRVTRIERLMPKEDAK